jgi:hypothetical protein
MPLPIIYTDSLVPDFGLPFSPEVVANLPNVAIEVLNDLKAKQEADPVHMGWRLTNWDEVISAENWRKYVVHTVLGGNRSSKSALMARITLHLAMSIPGARIRCWSMNEQSSVNDQQRVIWENLPAGYKNLPSKRKANYDINYSQKNGFTGSKLILPPVRPGYPGSEIIFQTYKSWMGDSQVSEGWWAHWIWGDEEMPHKLYETLLLRLIDARGRMGLSFTTLNGWTPLVADLLNGAKTIKKRRSDLVKRDLPVLQESRRARTVIHYFWTQDNPFIGFEDFLSDMANRPEAEKLARAHGVPTKSRTSVFSMFDRDVHVMAHDKIPFIKNPLYPVTKYHGIDPAGRKPWYILWGAYDAADTLWIYQEFPDMATYGEWVEPGGDDGGKPGPAQAKNDFGYKDYKELLFAGKEQHESDVVMSAVDPRYSASETQGDDGAETMLSKMLDHGVYLVPSPGKNIADGEGILTDMLMYDRLRPVGSDNRPRLMISDRCENLIFAMENYTGSGQDEPCKDPIDALRYLVQTANGFMDPSAKVVRGGGSY